MINSNNFLTPNSSKEELVEQFPDDPVLTINKPVTNENGSTTYSMYLNTKALQTLGLDLNDNSAKYIFIGRNYVLSADEEDSVNVNLIIGLVDKKDKIKTADGLYAPSNLYVNTGAFYNKKMYEVAMTHLSSFAPSEDGSAPRAEKYHFQLTPSPAEGVFVLKLKKIQKPENEDDKEEDITHAPGEQYPKSEVIDDPNKQVKPNILSHDGTVVQ